MIQSNSDLVGEVLGNYTLVKLIGHGGMGAVYLAKQGHPSRKVAVKVLLPNATRGSKLHNEFLARFQQEANVIANLEHINIIPIYDYGERDELAYLVMPYYPEGSLGHLLDVRGRLSLDEMMHFLDQAATALDHAHAHGVIHRDLKPSNFLLHKDGRPVLADFGIARIMHGSESGRGVTLTTTGTFVGTPAYMAPEMALGKQIDAYTDIYELGIVLFEMLNGDVPFKGETVFEIIDQHLEAPLPSLHRSNPAIPTSVDAVLRKATAKKGQDRYASAQALAQAMRYALSASQFPVARPLVLPGSAPLSVVNTTVQAKQQPYVVMSNVNTVSVVKKQLPRRRVGLGPIMASLYLLAALVLGVGLAGIFAANHPTGVAAPSPAQQAQHTVRQYYDSWNRGDYLATYNLLGSAYRKGHSYTDELHWYVPTRYSCVSIDNPQPLPDGSYQVAVIDNAIEDDSSGTGPMIHVYTLDYIVKREQGSWRLTPEHLQPIKKPGVCQVPGGS